MFGLALAASHAVSAAARHSAAKSSSKGSNTRAHWAAVAARFSVAAVDGGCVALLVERPLDVGVPQVVVADPQRALADLARTVQRERTRTRVVAITGSNGKTSVKALTLSILRRVGETTDPKAIRLEQAQWRNEGERTIHKGDALWPRKEATDGTSKNTPRINTDKHGKSADVTDQPANPAPPAAAAPGP